MAANFDGRMSRLFSLVTLLLPFFVFNAFDVGEGLRTCEHVPPISINRGHDYPIWDNQGKAPILNNQGKAPMDVVLIRTSIQMLESVPEAIK